MGPKSQTPGPNGRTKSRILEKRAQSAGGRVTRARTKKNPMAKSPTAKTPMAKTPMAKTPMAKNPMVNKEEHDDKKQSDNIASPAQDQQLVDMVTAGVADIRKSGKEMKVEKEKKPTRSQQRKARKTAKIDQVINAAGVPEDSGTEVGAKKMASISPAKSKSAIGTDSVTEDPGTEEAEELHGQADDKSATKSTPAEDVEMSSKKAAEKEKLKLQKKRGKSAKKRRLEEKSGKAGTTAKDATPLVKINKYDGPFFHCGNLPNQVDENEVREYFSGESVKLQSVTLKQDAFTTDIKKRILKKGQEDIHVFKWKKGQTKYCYAIIQGASDQDSKALEKMNGSLFTITSRLGTTNTHKLTLYPMLITTDKPCVYIKLSYKTEDKELFDFFTSHEVKPVKVQIARRGAKRISKGNAFAWFKSKEDMEKAIALSGTDLQDFTLDVSQAKSKQQYQAPLYEVGSMEHRTPKKKMKVMTSDEELSEEDKSDEESIDGEESESDEENISS